MPLTDLRSAARALVADPAPRAHCVSAVVSRAPESLDDMLGASWEYPDVAGVVDVEEDPIAWAGPGSTLPSEGDDCALLVDERGDCFALVWPSGASVVASATDLATLAGRVTSLEGSRTADEANISLLLSDRAESLKPQEVYGAGVSAAMGGVAPDVGESARTPSPQTSGVQVEPFAAVAGDMRMAITPSRNCWWRTRYSVITYPTELAWCRSDWSIGLTVPGTSTALADARGRVVSATFIEAGHGSVAYQTVAVETIWKLSAGTPYSARFLMSFLSGTTWNYWYGGTYFFGQAEVVGFW